MAEQVLKMINDNKPYEGEISNRYDSLLESKARQIEIYQKIKLKILDEIAYRKEDSENLTIHPTELRKLTHLMKPYVKKNLITNLYAQNVTKKVKHGVRISELEEWGKIFESIIKKIEIKFRYLHDFISSLREKN